MDFAAKTIAIDTNLLVYAHRKGTAEHKAARRAIQKASAGGSRWGIALPSLAEFWSVVTHSSCAGGPSSPAHASAFLKFLLRTGDGEIWLPKPGFAQRLLNVAEHRGTGGPRIFDLQIALVALENGATEIWTHDRLFVSVPGLRVRDPL